MISLNKCVKNYNDTKFKNINVFIEQSKNYAIVSNSGENSNVLLKLICGIYKVDSGLHQYKNNDIVGLHEDFFFIPSNPNYLIFDDVQALVDHYVLYYNKFDIYNIGDALNSINVTLFDKLSNLSFSKVKLLYLVLAIISKTSFIFIEDIFDGIDFDIVLTMKQMIQKQNKKNNRSFIYSSKEVNKLKDLTDYIIYDIDQKVGCVDKFYLRGFFKCTASFNKRFLEKDFVYFNPIYLKIYHKTIFIIFERIKEDVDKFLYNDDLHQYDELTYDLTDILYLGDYL